MKGSKSRDVIEIIGVYDADSTLVGEVSYWVKARFGVAHCALCDLTHGMFTMKRTWKECSRDLGVPVRTYHRNDAPRDVLAPISEFPAVLVRDSSGVRVALTKSDLEAMNGSTAQFIDWLHAYVTK